MIFMKCKCFSSLCSIRHKNGQYVHGDKESYCVIHVVFVGKLKRPMLVCVCAKVFANPNVEGGIFKFSEEFSKFQLEAVFGANRLTSGRRRLGPD